MKLSPLLLAALLALPTAACLDVDADELPGDDIGVAYGPIWQGPIWQGPIWQGPIWQGPGLYDGTLVKADITSSLRNADGKRLYSLRLERNQLVATELVRSGYSFTFVTRRGTDLTGATFESDGVGLKIIAASEVADSSMVGGFADNSGLWSYVLLVRDDNDRYRYLCGGDSYSDRFASFYEGSWDDRGHHHDDGTEWTVGCRKSLYHKCAIDLGYDPTIARKPPGRPWVKSIAMRPYFESCLRALSADLCGERVSFTSEGTLVSIEDDRGWNVPITDDDLYGTDYVEADFTDESWYGTADGRYRAIAANWLRYRLYTEEQLAPPADGTMDIYDGGGGALCEVDVQSSGDPSGWRIKIRSVQKEWDPYIPESPTGIGTLDRLNRL
jgi:hypothetical protein